MWLVHRLGFRSSGYLMGVLVAPGVSRVVAVQGEGGYMAGAVPVLPR